MTTQELKEYINRVLGNNIRCLLPSYWWKRLLGIIVDEFGAKTSSIDANIQSLDTSVQTLDEDVSKIKTEIDYENKCFVWTTDENSYNASVNKQLYNEVRTKVDNGGDIETLYFKTSAVGAQVILRPDITLCKDFIMLRNVPLPFVPNAYGVANDVMYQIRIYSTGLCEKEFFGHNINFIVDLEGGQINDEFKEINKISASYFRNYGIAVKPSCKLFNIRGEELNFTYVAKDFNGLTFYGVLNKFIVAVHSYDGESTVTVAPGEAISIPELESFNSYKAAFTQAGFGEGLTYKLFNFKNYLAYGVDIGSYNIKVGWFDDFGCFGETEITNRGVDRDRWYFGGGLFIGDLTNNVAALESNIKRLAGYAVTSKTMIYDENNNFFTPIRVSNYSDEASGEFTAVDVTIFNSNNQFETWRIFKSDGTSILLT